MPLTPQPAIPATTVPLANPYGQACALTITGGTVTGILVTPAFPAPVLTPALPATTVSATNFSGGPVAVAITGGTVSAVTVNGSATGLTASPTTAVVPVNGTIALTYTGSPAWTWSQLVAGYAGTSIPSPAYLPVPPGASVTLIYSVVPTSWLWSNPITEQGPGFLQGSNTVATIDDIHNLPYATHAAAGQTALGIAVAN